MSGAKSRHNEKLSPDFVLDVHCAVRCTLVQNSFKIQFTLVTFENTFFRVTIKVFPGSRNLVSDSCVVIVYYNNTGVRSKVA